MKKKIIMPILLVVSLLVITGCQKQDNKLDLTVNQGDRIKEVEQGK